MGESANSNHLTGSEVGANFTDQFAHYGIKGMRWGVRRSDKELARAAKEEPSEDSTVAKTNAARIKKSGVAALSNKELQAVITRTNLEQQYEKLAPESLSPGKRFANGFMDMAANSAKQAVTQQVAKQMTKGLELALKSANKK